MYQSNNAVLKTNSSIDNTNTRPILTKLLILVMSIACGLTVANLYYIQPLLGDIAKTFHVDQLSIGFAAMLTQIGYAIGMIFILPLGDIKEKRNLIVIMLLFSVISLMSMFFLFKYIYSYDLFFCRWVYFYNPSTYYSFGSTALKSATKRTNYWHNNERFINWNITFSYS